MGRAMVFVMIGLLPGAGLFSAACSNGTSSPTLPSAVATGSKVLADGTSDSVVGDAMRSSHGMQLTALAGEGWGVVNVTPNARNNGFSLNTQDSITVHGVAPNTVLYVRGAADAGLPGGQQSDGACQRASMGLFGPVAEYPGGPPATLITSPGGAGTVHIRDARNNPVLPEGGTMDIMLRLVDRLPPAVPTIDLRTPCFTLVVE